MKFARVFIVLVFVFVFCFCDCRALGFNNTSALYTHFTYIFAHGSLFHLLVNSAAFWCAFNLVRGRELRLEMLLASFLSAVVASFFFVGEAVTVGASGVVYAMFSAPASFVATGRVSLVDKKLFLRFYGIIFFATVLQMVLPAPVNHVVHVASFVVCFILLALVGAVRDVVRCLRR